MLDFLIVIDIILAILIIASIFLHNGPDGFMGDSTPTTQSTSGPKFETSDKIVAVLVALFFAVNLYINYITLYKDEGTARIDDIIAKKQKKITQEKNQKIENDIGAQDEAPIAE